MHAIICATIVFTSVLAVSAQTFIVLVGSNNGLTYAPAFLNATAGSTVVFQFVSQNHSVTQSTFDSPCVPNAFEGGVDSGFLPVAANATEFPQWSLTVNNANEPLYFVCRQTGHCEAGMVFAINVSNQTFSNFKANAIPPTLPGSVFSTTPSPTPNPTSAPNTMSNSASIILTTPPGAPSKSSIPAPSTSRNSTNIAPIVGGILGGLALLAILVFFFIRHRRQKLEDHRHRKALDLNDPGFSTSYDQLLMAPRSAAIVSSGLGDPEAQLRPYRPMSTTTTVTPTPFILSESDTLTEQDRKTKAERRQTQLRTQMDQMEQEMNELERIVRRDDPTLQPTPRLNIAEDAPDLSQLMQQVETMRVEIEQLRAQQQSDWALGVSNEPPPGYYFRD